MDQGDRPTYLEQLGGMLEWLPDAAVVVEADGTVDSANRNAETMLGYTGSELVGMPVDALLPEPLRAAHARERAGYVSAPAMRPMGIGLELVARRKDGSELPVEIRLGPVYTGDQLLVIATLRSPDRHEPPIRGRIGDSVSIGREGGSVREGTIVEVLGERGWPRRIRRALARRPAEHPLPGRRRDDLPRRQLVTAF